MMHHRRRVGWPGHAIGRNLPPMPIPPRLPAPGAPGAPEAPAAAVLGRPAARYLSALQVPETAERLYRRMLRHRTAEPASHARDLGLNAEEADAAFEALVAFRMVRRTADGEVLVEHPRSAVERLIESEEARIEDRRRELSRARISIAQFTAEHRAGQGGQGGSGNPAWEVVSVRAAPSMLEHLAASTTGVIRSSALTVRSGSGLSQEALRAAQEVVASGREQRAIYPLGAFDDPQGRQRMRAWAQMGERQRLSDNPPSAFAVFGDDAVLATAEWRATVADHVVIRDSMLVAAFISLFELAWEHALPLPQAAQDRAEDDRRLTALLARGFKDEVIARYLGWSVRTVRRRIAGLMVDLGVDTRFQLGVAAQRHGLLSPAGRPATRHTGD